MRPGGPALKLVPTDRNGESGPQAGAPRDGGTGFPQMMAPHPHPHGQAAGRAARHDLLREWMESHTRILGLWLDRLIEEGDDGDLVSMIHRQHAWLSMMQARMERG